MSKDNTLLINSGVKEIVPTGHAGVFFNKSGRGSSGYDVRACVVDEDYTGYVHLNVAFTGQDSSSSIVYCGDKLIQQLILPLYKSESEQISEDLFNKLTSKSLRGSAGFGVTGATGIQGVTGFGVTGMTGKQGVQGITGVSGSGSAGHPIKANAKNSTIKDNRIFFKFFIKTPSKNFGKFTT